MFYIPGAGGGLECRVCTLWRFSRRCFCIVFLYVRVSVGTMGPQIVQAYSRCGLTMALYEARRVSFCFPCSWRLLP